MFEPTPTLELPSSFLDKRTVDELFIHLGVLGNDIQDYVLLALRIFEHLDSFEFNLFLVKEGGYFTPDVW